GILLEAGASPPVAQCDERPPPRLFEKDAVRIQLIGPVDRFGDLIVRTGRGHSGELVPDRRHVDPRELIAGQAREVADIRRVIERQSYRADALHEPEPPVVFHRPGAVAPAAWKFPRSWLRLDQLRADPAAREIERHHETHRPPADYDDRRG